MREIVGMEAEMITESPLVFQNERHGTELSFEKWPSGLRVILESNNEFGRREQGIAFWLTPEQAKELWQWIAVRFGAVAETEEWRGTVDVRNLKFHGPE